MVHDTPASTRVIGKAISWLICETFLLETFQYRSCPVTGYFTLSVTISTEVEDRSKHSQAQSIRSTSKVYLNLLGHFTLETFRLKCLEGKVRERCAAVGGRGGGGADGQVRTRGDWSPCTVVRTTTCSTLTGRRPGRGEEPARRGWWGGMQAEGGEAQRGRTGTREKDGVGWGF